MHMARNIYKMLCDGAIVWAQWQMHHMISTRKVHVLHTRHSHLRRHIRNRRCSYFIVDFPMLADACGGHCQISSQSVCVCERDRERALLSFSTFYFIYSLWIGIVYERSKKKRSNGQLTSVDMISSDIKMYAGVLVIGISGTYLEWEQEKKEI